MSQFVKIDIPPTEFPGTVKAQDPMQFTEMSPEFKRWVSNFTDNINTDLDILSTNGAFIPNVVTTSSMNLIVGNLYISNLGSLITYTLPTVSSVGNVIRICEIAAGGTFKIAQNSGQKIQFGSASTTVGVTGSLTSTAIGDCIELICTVDNTTWIAFSSKGTFTVA